MFLGWMNIAWRDAALTIWNYGNAMSSAISCAKQCPSILAHLSLGDLDALRREFAEKFPSATAIRNAICHEVNKFPRKRASNAASGELTDYGMHLGAETSGYLVRGGAGDRVFVTIGNEVHDYTLDEATASILSDLHDRFIAVFEPAGRALNH